MRGAGSGPEGERHRKGLGAGSLRADSEDDAKTARRRRAYPGKVVVRRRQKLEGKDR